MELVTPGAGLLFWQAAALSSILFFLVSWMMILLTNRLDGMNKLVWLIGTMFLPVIGPLIFFVKYASFKR